MIICFDKLSEYRNEISALWNECFKDSYKYIDFFIDNINNCVCVADERESKFVSMLFLIDGNLCDLKIKYLYAACTSDNYRRLGIMESLIQYSKSYCIENSYDAVFLVPASESLYLYYSKFGFKRCFEKCNIAFSKALTQSIPFCEDVDFNELYCLRESLLKNINSFSFNTDNFNYSLNEHLQNGGKIISVNSEDEKGYAFYHFSDNNIIVKELLSSKGLKSSLITALFEKYQAENVYILCPLVYNNKDTDVVCTKCGMALPLSSKANSYIINGQPFYAAMYLD